MAANGLTMIHVCCSVVQCTVLEPAKHHERMEYRETHVLLAAPEYNPLGIFEQGFGISPLSLS